MDIRKIEQLLEKFYEGTSSSEDEQLLRDFFRNDNLPEHLASLRPQFCFSSHYVASQKTNDVYEAALGKAIILEEKTLHKLKQRKFVFSIAAAAAVVLLMIGILSIPKPTNLEDTFNNPVQAYEEASKALFYVSEQLNKGLKPIHEGSEKLRTGLEKTNELNRLDIIQNFIKTE
jgi:hypothetical protein